MSIISQLQSQFPSHIRIRGNDYFLKKRVSIEILDTKKVLATVVGTEKYFVLIEAGVEHTDRSRFFVKCSCPYFEREDNTMCKHVWATIIEVDKVAWWGNSLKAPVVIPSFWDRKHLKEIEREIKNSVETTPHSVRNNTNPLDWPQLQDFISTLDRQSRRHEQSTQKQREIWYGLDTEAARRSGKLTINLFARNRLKSGMFSKLKEFKYAKYYSANISNPLDLKILNLLSSFSSDAGHYSIYSRSPINSFTVDDDLMSMLVPLLSQCGHFFSLEQPNPEALRYDEGLPSWQLKLKLEPTKTAANKAVEQWSLRSFLQRGDEQVELQLPRLLLRNGYAIMDKSIEKVAISSDAEFEWIVFFRKKGDMKLAETHMDSFFQALMSLPHLPSIEWPPEFAWSHVEALPKPCLALLRPDFESQTIEGKVLFDYPERQISSHSDEGKWLSKEGRIIYSRNRDIEKNLFEDLLSLTGVVVSQSDPDDETRSDVTLPLSELSSLLDSLDTSGWAVEAQAAKIKKASTLNTVVSSGTDWFDVSLSCEFGDLQVLTPDILHAAKQRSLFVKLGDGSMGLLPHDWLSKYKKLVELASMKNGKMRFHSAHVTILDDALENLPHVSVDKNFSQLRKKIKDFSGIKPRDPEPQFKGTLRPYQKEGLAWLHYLQDFGFGGCLADDMGLGKTVQVLALLQSYYMKSAPQRRHSSLLVVPRTLVHNWIEEAHRFCPELKILDYSHAGRSIEDLKKDNYHIAITTYAMMRMDCVQLQSIKFDYAILDEAQAIKNETAQVTKASRLLKAKHRLAISGTPVENHLGELGSIFTFLSPGLLSSSYWETLFQKGAKASAEEINFLGRVLRPFILRRRKEQVLQELPEKSEQILYCDLSKRQTKYYNELKLFYRQKLQDTISKKGMNRSKIEVLEALLRLRQLACHVGLVDIKKKKEESAKLEVLLEHLKGLIAGGHKALVFSQFTSLLALVKEKLDHAGIRYEYLDGSTVNRKERVDRFQSDPKVSVFLLSLKAGGVGLNLTSADYCFILDPWWNPAVEAQAIDRAHRIGQSKKVFAYRLIARNTVEEKILVLQDKKRDLANAIITGENSALRKLTLDDLNLLLS